MIRRNSILDNCKKEYENCEKFEEGETERERENKETAAAYKSRFKFINNNNNNNNNDKTKKSTVKLNRHRWEFFLRRILKNSLKIWRIRSNEEGEQTEIFFFLLLTVFFFFFPRLVSFEGIIKKKKKKMNVISSYRGVPLTRAS